MVRSGSSAHIDVYARPASKSATEANQIAVKAEGDLAHMTALFAVANNRKYDFFIFDDLEDFHAVTKAAPPVAGFAFRGAAFFVLNSPALAHELAHAVAGDKIGITANEFLREGLACIIFDPARMASYDAEMKYLMEHKKLPALAPLHAVDGRAKSSEKSPEVNFYKMGGSWLSFIFRTQGSAKAKEYYRTGNTEKAFGIALEKLEMEWRSWLANYPLRAEAAEALARMFSPAEDTRTIIDGETFSLYFAAPKELQGYSQHLEKDGKPLPAQKETLLFLMSAQTSDAGTYQLISTRPGERHIISELRLEVVDPRIFLPLY